MFEPYPFDLNGFIRGCQEQWDTTPRPYWLQTQFGDRNLSTGYSNIVFRCAPPIQRCGVQHVAKVHGRP